MRIELPILLTGMETALSVINPTPGDSSGIDQGLYTDQGNAYVFANYADVSLITSCKITSTRYIHHEHDHDDEDEDGGNNRDEDKVKKPVKKPMYHK